MLACILLLLLLSLVLYPVRTHRVRRDAPRWCDACIFMLASSDISLHLSFLLLHLFSSFLVFPGFFLSCLFPFFLAQRCVLLSRFLSAGSPRSARVALCLAFATLPSLSLSLARSPSTLAPLFCFLFLLCLSRAFTSKTETIALLQLITRTSHLLLRENS